MAIMPPSKPAPVRRADHLADGECGVVAAGAETCFAHVIRGAGPGPAGSPPVQLPAATPRHPGSEGPSLRKRTVRNENTGEILPISSEKS